jgi:hypothetical protein
MGREEGGNRLDGVLQALALVDETIGDQYTRGVPPPGIVTRKELRREGRDTVGDDLHTARGGRG